MNNNVGDMRWNLRKCNNVYVIIIPQIDAMKVSLSSINVFFLQGIKPLNEEKFLVRKFIRFSNFFQRTIRIVGHHYKKNCILQSE